MMGLCPVGFCPMGLCPLGFCPCGVLSWIHTASGIGVGFDECVRCRRCAQVSIMFTGLLWPGHTRPDSTSTIAMPMYVYVLHLKRNISDTVTDSDLLVILSTILFSQTFDLR